MEQGHLFFKGGNNTSTFLFKEAMQDFKITIPKPCRENWDSMTPNEQGKHCCVCEKTVVDFTNMQPEEIKSYFETRKDKKVCGRFYTSQVSKSLSKFHVQLLKLQFFIEKKLTLPRFKKIVLSGLSFVMLITGCSQEEKTTNEPLAPERNDSIIPKIDSVKTDSTKIHVKPISESSIHVDTTITILESYTSGNVMPVLLGDICVDPMTYEDPAIWPLGKPRFTLLDTANPLLKKEEFKEEMKAR